MKMKVETGKVSISQGRLKTVSKTPEIKKKA
jgi:hypothetical protein